MHFLGGGTRHTRRKRTTAVRIGSFDQAVKLLLDKGANPNAEIGDEESPSTVACIEGYEEVVKVLLDNDADPNQEVDG